MQVLEQWVMLLDERGLRATGMELLIRVENGKAPPLSELCSSPEISLSEVERTISQDPSQCGEREVNTRTGMLPLHALLANQADWPDEILALLLKCNHRQARVADRHGNLPLHYLCKRFGLTERQLTMLIKCFGDAAKAPNRYGKLPLHFLARNPSLTRPMLALLVEAYPGATTARDQSGSLPLHYVAQNPSLSKETLQSFLAACGPEGSKEAAEAADKYGNVPLRHLVTSTAFTDQHLRVMLRANDRAVQVKDRYGNPPLEYLGFNREVSGFQQQVATEARRAIDRAELMVSDAEGAGRVVGDATALRLLMGVQKYALLFHDFSLAEVRSLVHGLKGQRMLVTRFAKGDVLVRRGEAATFFGLLLEGELGLRPARELGLRPAREAGGGGAGGGFPRRLHRGSLFGQSGLFDQGLRRSDVVAVSEGHVATLLYSELELLGASFPDVMRKLNLQLAKADIEQRLSERDMSLDDLADAELQRQARAVVRRSRAHSQWVRSVGPGGGAAAAGPGAYLPARWYTDTLTYYRPTN